ncbi:hypothetical protein GCM10027577_40820 [Spirosoma fluminis]
MFLEDHTSEELAHQTKRLAAFGLVIAHWIRIEREVTTDKLSVVSTSWLIQFQFDIQQLVRKRDDLRSHCKLLADRQGNR